MADPKKTYFANLDPKRLTADLLTKEERYYDYLERSGALSLISQSYETYYGMSGGQYGHTASQVSAGGEQGELTLINVNHYRNFVKHLLSLTTSQLPYFETESINSDSSSLITARLARSILDEYLYRKDLHSILTRVAEICLVESEGFLVTGWDTAAGEEYGYDSDLARVIYEGDLWFDALGPSEVIRDLASKNTESLWYVTVHHRNKWDLAAQYPEKSDEILRKAKPVHEHRMRRVAASELPEDHVMFYRFFHQRTAACPAGRYMEYLADGLWLVDVPLPTREVPVYRMSPSNVIRTQLGYTVGFDLLGLQKALNSLYSAILSNQTAFAVQTIVGKRGAAIDYEKLSQGMAYVEVDNPEADIKVLQLTSSPQEVFTFAEILQGSMETLTAVNSVTRGEPDASLRTGSALALVQAMTVQFNDDLNKSYAKLLEKVLTAILDILRTNATVPRLVSITGQYNRAETKQFTGQDLQGVHRVRIHAANPMFSTTAGKLTIAQPMMEAGRITVDQYMQIMTTGTLEAATEDAQAELILVKAENEKMQNGEVPTGSVTDDHLLHIKRHKCGIDDPEVRANPELVQAHMDHILWHWQTYESLSMSSPGLLAALGQMPLPQPPGMAPMGGGPADVMAPPDSTMGPMPDTQPAQMPELPANPSAPSPGPGAE